MNAKYLASFCIALGLSLLLVNCAPASPAATAAEPAVVEVTGTVEVTEIPWTLESTLPSVTTETPVQELTLWFKVLKGTADINGFVSYDGEMKAGDTLTTGSSGFVELYLSGDDRALFEVKPSSIIRAETVTSAMIRLYLEMGSVRATVKDGAGLRVVIAAKAGESEAGGTTWISEVDQTGALLVAVLEGRVIARAPGGYEVAVNDNERLDIPVDGVPGWPVSTIYVYFDTTYNEPIPRNDGTEELYTLAGEYRRMDEFLSDPATDFYIESSMSFQGLGTSYDVLIMAPNRPMDSVYIKAIQEWVQAGHGLIFMGEWQNGIFDQATSNELLAPYGIRFLDRERQYGTATLVPDHPVTWGGNKLELDWYGQLELNWDNLPGDATLTPLGYAADTGALVLAAYEGSGRVLVLADWNALDNSAWDLYPSDTSAFLINALKWLFEAQY